MAADSSLQHPTTDGPLPLGDMRRNILVGLYRAALDGEHIAARIFLHATEPSRMPPEITDHNIDLRDLTSADIQGLEGIIRDWRISQSRDGRTGGNHSANDADPWDRSDPIFPEDIEQEV